jgi:enamine deaminase RidA (YjgF/YER057c/UK114 family)
MERPVRHEIVDVPELGEAVGFSHAVVAAPGRTVYLAGQTGSGASIADQLDAAAGKVVAALRAAGAGPEDLVSLVVYVTDVDEYRSSLRQLGEVWRRHFGRRYPALALIGVAALFEPEARVELMGVAVVADG